MILPFLGFDILKTEGLEGGGDNRPKLIIAVWWCETFCGFYGMCTYDNPGRGCGRWAEAVIFTNRKYILSARAVSIFATISVSQLCIIYHSSSEMLSV